MENIRGYLVGVRSDLYEGAMTEDGERPTEESFYVLIEDAEEGHRWRSNRVWTTEAYWQRTYVDGCWHIAAEELARCHARVVEKVLAEGKVNPRNSMKWRQTDPVYGSKAYVDYGQADEVMWERKEAEMGR